MKESNEAKTKPITPPAAIKPITKRIKINHCFLLNFILISKTSTLHVLGQGVHIRFLGVSSYSFEV